MLFEILDGQKDEYLLQREIRRDGIEVDIDEMKLGFAKIALPAIRIRVEPRMNNFIFLINIFFTTPNYANNSRLLPT